jgi:predicted transcriptional regulator of viral defense system
LQDLGSHARRRIPNMHTTTRITPTQLPDYLIAQGRYWLTTAEASEFLDRPRRLIYSALADLEDANKLFSPAQGFYVVVPPEYRSWGVVPGDWFIDPMMRHLGRSYYVAFLSAAARHGAAHQAPQTFQVIVDRQVRNRDLGRIRLRFAQSQVVEAMATEAKNSHTGSYNLATRETTAVDLAWRPRDGAGLSNVATVLKEIGDLDSEQLARLSDLRGRSTARRLGWLLESVRPDVDTFWLRKIAQPDDGAPTKLSPSGPFRGRVDRSWGIKVNSPVEPDV